jgi:C1A family cysteine protease
MRSLAVAAFCAVVALGSKWQEEHDLVDFGKMKVAEEFESWKSHFGKSYETPDEEYTRFKNWIDNMQKIAQYNSMDLSFKLRMNQFGDLDHDEFRTYVHGKNGKCYAADEKPQFTIGEGKMVHKDGDNPASVDWTTKGVVTPVKNQGQCGSCWAFSTTGAIECNYAIQHGTLNSLSEQQLVDCSRSYGNYGCDGGLMDNAFKYVEATGGLCSESEYPYTASDGICKSSSCGTMYDAITGYSDVTKDNSGDLETAAAAGCVSVAIEADQFAFQYYSSGVLDGTCGTNLDHGVLVVGYGTYTNNEEYWKVKNSWGTDWGMEGYVLICRECDKNGRQGECGILDQPSQPST